MLPLRSTFTALALAALALGAGAVGFRASRRAHETRPPSSRVGTDGARVLHVPLARGPIVLNGDPDDPGWQAGVRTHAFVGEDGVSPARPHTEARFVRAEEYLYVTLYAADEDLRAGAEEHDTSVSGDDEFHLVFTDEKTERVLEINPMGVLVDGTRPAGSNAPLDLGWESGARISVDRDGTPNHPEDHDEEWVIEMAIPLEALGLEGRAGESIGLSMRRCDTLRNTTTTLCGTWGVGSADGGFASSGGAGRGVLVFERAEASSSSPGTDSMIRRRYPRHPLP
jgi:hypothetical protein